MTMKTKRLPVGMDSFEKIIDQDYYYLDKTRFIKTLIESAGEVNLFTRPRRFGKSLTLSMLKAFFEIGSDSNLFSGLAISQDTTLCEEYQGKFPVVSLTLKGVEGLTYESAISKLRILVSTEYKRFSFLETSDRVNVYDKEIYRNLCSQKNDDAQLTYSLVSLMRMLHSHYGKKVVLLIDEYDVPLDKGNENGYYDKIVSFFRTFFGEAFKTNPDLQFAVVTGCLRISKESIFTGINNLNVDSISDYRFDEYFGFTDDDVKKILKDFSLSHAYEEMKEWYDGYHFGDTDVYCPWDVINHCKRLLEYPKAEPQAYWNNTSSNYMVKRFIDKADRATRNDIEALISGEAIERPLTENLTYSEIDESIENLWSVLYLTGYLTKDRKQKAKTPGCVRLVIPNKEVRIIFVDKIQKWFRERVRHSADTLNEMYHALACGEADKVEKILSSQLRHTISYHDQREDFYHGFLMGLLSPNQDWDLKSNREMGLGRSDITLEDDEGEFGVIIEIKRAAKSSDMESKCEEALQQIRDRGYAEELIDEVDAVWIYGIAFAEKKCRIKAERLK